MNKDLDDRLIPNGEYRNAQNVSVGKSEDDDIGALENIKGNELVPNSSSDPANFTPKIAGLEIIGTHVDKNNSRIFIFATNNTDSVIYEFTEPNNYVTLVQGKFLNFNTSTPITGTSLIEELLFFTDNTNPPRKINIKKSAELEDYYKNDYQISVAKYSPYKPINLLNKITVTGITTPSPITNALTIPTSAGVKKGMSLAVYNGNNSVALLEPEAYLYVESVSGTTVTMNKVLPVAITSGYTLYFVSTKMTGEEITYNFNDGNAATWPGDPDFLEARYARFSYRYQYDDGEYSIMAPFSPIAFIPKQRGFILAGNEDEAYQSTVLELMENGVQNVELSIELPDDISNLSDVDNSSYKIIGIDILYKEAESRAVKVVDTIPLSSMVARASNNIFTYQYQSSKPFRTLPENQTTRVFDKVPVKAYSQETAGNRIIYGNFKDKYTPPSSINYKVGVGPKDTSPDFQNWAEFPNHSVKQNRNYQVGFVLADKFGRQSSVILASEDIANTTTLNGVKYGGSTVYSPYDNASQANQVRNWFGDALSVIVENEILDPDPLPVGHSGMYATATSLNGVSGFDVSAIANINTAMTIPVLQIPGFEYQFTVTASTNVPQLENYLRGQYIDFVEVVEVSVTGLVYKIYTERPINSNIYGDIGIKFSYIVNPNGWYSYKIVVKQNEQEYYNVYLPGIIKGYPDQTSVTPVTLFPVEANISNIVLLNDNINKIPRDLTEVGPDQKQYRSSVQLYGRVENTLVYNTQFYPYSTASGTIPLTDTAISISTANDSNMSLEIVPANNTIELYSSLSVTGLNSVYQIDTNPLIARISTSKDIGVESTPSSAMVPQLAIYETEPVDSLLDIYWETSTAGLIADLNADILTDFNGATGFEPYTWSQDEAKVPGVTAYVISGGDLVPTDKTGSVLAGTTLNNFVSSDSRIRVKNSTSGFPVSADGTTNGFNFYIDSGFTYNDNSAVNDVFTLSFTITTSTGISSGTLQVTGSLQNVDPIITNQSPSTITNDNTTVNSNIRTFAGVNGSIVNNQSQLQFSIASVTPASSAFTISSAGVLGQNLANPGTYAIVIRLTDANGGTGSSFDEVTQTVIVQNSEIGFKFYASATVGQIPNVCPINNQQNSDCGSTPYWNTGNAGGGGGTGTPAVGDVIRTGPNGAASNLAAIKYYSFDCGNVNNPPTGTSRRVFELDSNGTVVTEGYCGIDF
mgnify:FL=1